MYIQILEVDPENPNAYTIADLSKPNTGQFFCLFAKDFDSPTEIVPIPADVTDVESYVLSKVSS